MARPSPRTQGVDEEGKTFQLFGTQQLSFAAGTPPKLGTPYQGVTQVDTGKNWKKFTTSGYTGTKTTAFSQQFQSGITGVQRTVPRDVAIEMQKAKLQEMGLPQLPDLGDLFGGGAIDKHGCECENCKNGTGQCSDKNPKCNAWDIGCEWFGANDKHGCECEACKNGTGQCSDKVPQCNAWDIGCEVTGGITNPIGSWWEKYGIWVYVILGVIGLGILLWLLRPLFGIIGAFKGGSP